MYADDAPAEDASAAAVRHKQDGSVFESQVPSSTTAGPGSVDVARQQSAGSNNQAVQHGPSRDRNHHFGALATTESRISVSPTAMPRLASQGDKDGSNNGSPCFAGGKTHPHGSQWHPVMGPFGEMECVLCICDEGQISCHRLHCPSAQALGCGGRDLIKITGRCCPTCPSEHDQGTVKNQQVFCAKKKKKKERKKPKNPLLSPLPLSLLLAFFCPQAASSRPF